MSSAKNSMMQPQSLIANALGYARHGRLMGVLLLLGLTVGLIYFVYTKSLFYSRSLVSVNIFNLPVHSESGEAVQTPVFRLRRSLLSKLNSRYLIARTAVRLGIAPEGTSYETVVSQHIPKVRVNFVDGNNLQIEVWPYDPRVAREFSEALIAEFDAYESELRRDYREKALGKYATELKEVRGKLDERFEEKSKFEKENRLAELFIAQNQLNEVPTELVLTRHRIDQIKSIGDTLEAQKATLDTVGKLSLLTSFKNEKPLEPGRIVRRADGTSPISRVQGPQVVVQPDMVEGLEDWEVLEKEQRKLKEEIKLASITYKSGHEIMRDLNGKLADVDTGLKRELATAVQHFELESMQLTEKLNQLNEKLPEYHRITEEYERFRQTYQLMEKGELAWDKAYKRLAEQLSSLQFGADKDRVELNFTGLVSLRDKDPVAPSKTKLVMIALIVGAGAAGGVPFLLEMFNDTTSKMEQIENATNLKGIGVIPLVTKEQLEDIARSPTVGAEVPNFLLEQFRIIRSNIYMEDSETRDRARITMITSARPSEGKTTQAANISWAFNSVGEKTLIIDTDLRRGRVHGVLDLDNSVGMTSLLTGQVSKEEVIQRTAVDNLFAIPRGPIIPGSTEILCHETFEDLIAEWSEDFDNIILDCPPVLGLSETTALQRVVDGVVLVVKAEATSLRDVTDAVTLLKKSGANFFGFVLNRIDLAKTRNYYNYYYYSAHYYNELDPGISGGPQVRTRTLVNKRDKEDEDIVLPN